jgi:hypothetical protein
MDGFPVKPMAVFTASSGDDVEIPLTDAAPSLMASVLPLTVTESVFDPVVDAIKYHTSAVMPVVRVVVALVKAAPFHDAEPILPAPAMSCQISAVSTIKEFALETVCVQVFVVVPLKPSVILVDVDVTVGVDVDVPPGPVPSVVVTMDVTASGSA